MFADQKSGDYLTWHFCTRQQGGVPMTHFLHREDSVVKSVIRINDFCSDATAPAAGFSTCTHENCRVFSEKPDDIVDIIRNARIRLEHRISVIHQKVSGPKSGSDQVRTALNTFVAGVAHHFNNLFMTIQANVSLVMMDTGKDHPRSNRLKRIERLRSGTSLNI